MSQRFLLAGLTTSALSSPPLLDLTTTKKQVAHFAAAGCSLAVAAGMPSKFKGYLDALLAVSQGRDEFATTNHEIAKYLCDTRRIKYESALRIVTRNATGFFAWQDGTNTMLVTREVGYQIKETKEGVPSKYRVPILSLIAEVLHRGGWMNLTVGEQENTIESLQSGTDNLSGSLLDDAQAAIREHKLAHLCAGSGSSQRFPGGRPSGDRKPSSYCKAALTMIRKMRGKCSCDPETRELLRLLAAEVVAELETLGDDSHATYAGDLVHTDTEEVEGTDSSVDPEETQGGSPAWQAIVRSLGGADVDDNTSQPEEIAEHSVPPCVSEPSALVAYEPPADITVSAINPLREAARGAVAFLSVGVESFFSIHKCERTNRALSEATDTFEGFESSISSYLRRAEASCASFCVRPEGDNLIQVDDCSPEVLDRLTPFSFLTIETSPSSYQCWLALPAENADERAAVRNRLLCQLAPVGANGGAYNSLRFPGSRNFKLKHEPIGFPMVRVLTADVGRFVTSIELDCAGLLAPPVSLVSRGECVERGVMRPMRFPSWQRELDRVKLKADGTPDRSDADFRWCLLALRWGWSESEIADKLREVSTKAVTAPRHYVKTTVRRAAGYV